MFISLKNLVKSPIVVELVITPKGNFGVHCTEMVDGEINTFNRDIVVKDEIKGIIL